MMVKKFYCFLSVLLLTGCSPESEAPAETTAQAQAVAPEAALPAGVTLVDEYDGVGDAIAIPYKKYRLENGLTVVLHEDRSDPLIHVDVTYHVGSNREEVGRSGFAHFFEHMMFQGSENIGDEEHFKIVSDSGGTLNGTTNTDRTNYYQTVPANQLETVLWLEADRMGLLLPAVTQEKFEVQRETVKNERGQRVDNQPYGRVFETLDKHLYPEGHPYSWPVIGWIEDLNRADVTDLKRFFLRWYGPNNAVVTIGGDIDHARTLELVARYFGPIPRGPEVEDLPKQPASLDADRYVTLEDNIHLPALALTMPTVSARHADEPAIDAAAMIMGQGQASLLYQRLVQTGRAVQVNVSHPCRELACAMVFVAVQNPQSGETLAEMEQAVRETLTEFAERGVSEDDLAKFKAQYESGRIFGLQSVSGKVSTLAHYETFTGTPKGINTEIDKYLNVTVDDVKRVFEQYIADGKGVVLSIVPNGQTALAARPQDHEVPDRTIPERSDEGELPLRPVADTFDRSSRPIPGMNPTVELPNVWEGQLANEVRLLGVDNKETPTTTIRAVFELGGRDEVIGKAGITSLMASLMSEATTERTAAEFAEALERIGASVSVSASTYQTTVTLNTLTKHLDAALELMQERLLKPAFLEEDFNRVKQQTLEGLQQQRKSPGPLAALAADVVLYGKENPIAYPNAGLPATVESISHAELVAYYQENIPSRLGGVLISSDLGQQELAQKLSGLGTLAVMSVERTAGGTAKAMNGRTVYLIDKPGAAQSSLRLVHAGIPYDAFGDYYKAYLGNFILGGAFNSRINLNLREDKGYSYGARSGFNGGPEVGSFRVSTDVNKEATAASVTEILNELEKYDAEGMNSSDFEFMQNAIGQSEARSYETPNAKLGLLSRVLLYDLPSDYRRQQQQILRSAEPSDLNAVIQRLLDPENLGIVVVGDKASVSAELEALGMPIVEMDPDGEVLP
jgi:zinc protease